ncbi:hypothetical protein LTR85_006381 [Meristemomyces frigidus]|nr:hypothetical protein LTR85_006381 [Meristemomyces frigidus]
MVLHLQGNAPAFVDPAAWFRLDFDAGRLPAFMTGDLFPSAASASHFSALKIILPRRSGYWCRKNIIQQRFVDSGAMWVRDYSEARQSHSAPNLENLSASSLLNLLSTAVGSIQLHTVDSGHQLEQEFTVLEAEVLNRLSLPLLLPNPIPRYRIAILHGRYDWTMTQAEYRAAQEMDIEVHVLAEPGHWMQHKSYASYRKSFIAINTEADNGLPDRIIEALHDLRLDGLVTFTDKWLIPVAYAAQALNLPTESPSLFETCRDKYLTRLLDVPEGFQSVRVEGYGGAKAFLDSAVEAAGPKFPLVVKPCAGYASEGVRKVYDESGLLDAAARANLSDYGRGDLVTIETYIDGPEVDANFILWEGHPLFCEISDQFPAEADLDNTAQSTFMETELLLPSALPPSEQRLVQEKMLVILSKLGARNGVFHMEARMRSSSMEYRVKGGRQMDLARKAERSSCGPECVLIENNPRPPGTNSNAVIARTYGVDFYALQWLIALGDGQRVRALSVPYLAGAQYHCDLVSIPATKGGMFASRDATGDLLERFTELRRVVVLHGSYYDYGAEVPDPTSGRMSQIAFFLVASPTSREEVLTAAQRIRQEFEYTLLPSENGLVSLAHT